MDDDKPKRVKVDLGGSATSDDESKSIIYEGLNQTQMCKLFKMDSKTVKEKLHVGRVKPISKRHNGDIYAFLDVAPHLVRPIFDVETYIKRMSHHDLPKTLTREFWQGMRTRQEYELNEGLLWKTEKVVEEVGGLMKLIKTSTLLMLDAVERETELTQKQRAIIQNLARGMLSDLMCRIETKFKVPDVKRQKEVDDEEL